MPPVNAYDVLRPFLWFTKGERVPWITMCQYFTQVGRLKLEEEGYVNGIYVKDEELA